MSTTPTPAETPRTDYEEKRLDAWDDGKRFVSSDFARTLERELATAQAELTTLREKLAEEQAGAASMRDVLKTEFALQNPFNHPMVATRLREVLEATTGKATLEELERVKRSLMAEQVKCGRIVLERDTALAEVEQLKASARTDGEWNEALATITELRARLQIIHDGAEDAIKGNPSGLMSAGWVHFQCKALSPPAAPQATEPEKADSAPIWQEFGDNTQKLEAALEAREKAGSAEPQPATVSTKLP